MSDAMPPPDAQDPSADIDQSAAAPAAWQRTSQWDIALRQFRKRRTAVWGLRGTVALWILAAYAPVFCSGLPFSWSPPGSDETTYPWFGEMFNRNYWKSGVDRLFNLIMLATTVWFLAWGGLRLARWAMDLPQGTYLRVRGWAAKGIFGLGVLVAILQAFGLDALHGDTRYVDYVSTAREHMAEGHDPSSFSTFPLNPFGHAEQFKGSGHRYLGPGTDTPFARHLLGTDDLGRDLLSRLIYGTRISLTVGVLAVGIYVIIGIILGGLAGYFGGKVDLLIMRLIEIMLCIPGLFLILTIVALFNVKSIFMIMIAIGLVGWTGIARLIRGEFIRERGMEYVQAARSMGMGHARILFRHILPNALGPVIVAASFGIAAAIITESTLSFLGLGDKNVPSWGQILSKGRMDGEWHLILAPGIAVFLTVTLLNLVGDGLRDALDPKLRK